MELLQKRNALQNCNGSEKAILRLNMELCPRLRECSHDDHVLKYAKKQFWFKAADAPAFFDLPQRIMAPDFRTELDYIVSSQKAFTSHPTYQKIIQDFDGDIKAFSRSLLHQSAFAAENLKTG